MRTPWMLGLTALVLVGGLIGLGAALLTEGPAEPAALVAKPERRALGLSVDAGSPAPRETELLASVPFTEASNAANAVRGAIAKDLVPARFGRPMAQLEGRVEVHGEPDRRVTGWLELRTQDGHGERLGVEVIDGRFSASVPRAASYEVVAIQSEGPALIALTARLALAANGQSLVQVMPSTIAEIQVVAQEDGRPLAHPLLVRTGRIWPSGQDHPGALRAAEQAGQGEVRVPITLARETIFIGAEGRAWQRIDLDATRPAPELVQLSGAAALTVHLIPEGRAGERVTIHTASDARSAPRAEAEALGRSEIPFSALSPGHVFVQRERGQGPDHVVLARERVELRPGAQVDLRLADHDGRGVDGRVALRGTVIAGSAYGEALPRIEFLPVRVDPMATRIALPPDRVQALGQGVFRFDAGRVLPGEWRASVHGQMIPFTVLAGRDAEIRLDLVPPLALRVQVRNRDTGRAIEDAIAIVNRGSESGVAANTFAPGQRGEEPGEFVFQTPPGPLLLRVRAPGHRPIAKTIDLAPGQAPLVVELESEQGLALELWSGARQVDWPRGMAPELTPVHGAMQGVPSASIAGARATLHVPEPGAFRLRFPRLPGHPPLEERIVEIDAGKMGYLRVDLHAGAGS